MLFHLLRNQNKLLRWNISQSLDSKFGIKWVIKWSVEENWKVVKLYMGQKDFVLQDFKF